MGPAQQAAAEQGCRVGELSPTVGPGQEGTGLIHQFTDFIITRSQFQGGDDHQVQCAAVNEIDLRGDGRWKIVRDHVPQRGKEDPAFASERCVQTAAVKPGRSHEVVNGRSLIPGAEELPRSSGNHR